jgi:hypothetical protein
MPNDGCLIQVKTALQQYSKLENHHISDINMTRYFELGTLASSQATI